MGDRVLDIQIAEKVMGWKLGNHPGVYGCWLQGSTTMAYETQWAPSTDIDDAWQVVEKMRERGLFLDLQNDFPVDEGGPWWAEFADAGKENGVQSWAPDAALAICRAALLFVVDILED